MREIAIDELTGEPGAGAQPAAAGIPKPEAALYEIDSIAFAWRAALWMAMLLLGGLLCAREQLLLVIGGVLLLGIAIAHGVELSHQALHHTAFRSALLNEVSGVILAMPLLVSYYEYRINHLKHHSLLGTPENKEHFDYGDDWSFKGLVRRFLMPNHYVSYIKNMGLALSGRDVGVYHPRYQPGVRRFYWLSCAAILTLIAFSIALHSAKPVLCWFLAMALVGMPVHGLIEMPEHHGCPTDQRSIFKNTRTLRSNRFATWFTNSNNFHVEHHLWPSIPMQNAHRLHERCARFAEHLDAGYVSFFRSLISGRPSVPQAATKVTPAPEIRASDPERATLDRLNQSLSFDQRLLRHEIECSQAHVRMLERQRLLDREAASTLVAAYSQLLHDAQTGAYRIDPNSEDIYSDLQAKLRVAVGEVAGRAVMGRGRNDTAPTALRLWLRGQCDQISQKLDEFIALLAKRASDHADTLMPGPTHGQPAQPISLGHLYMAYCEMLGRDLTRFASVRASLNECPMGACALAGTSFDIDPHYTAQLLGFDRPSANSLDAVGDRDFVLDFLSAAATAAIHLSRMAEDTLVWVAPQYGFFSLPPFIATSSAVLPHKRNPDVLELVRAKTGRIVAALHGQQVVLKALGTSYNRDLQEDKESTFDAADSYQLCLDAMTIVFRHIVVEQAAMADAADRQPITAPDYVDWLAQHTPMSYGDAHHLVCDAVKASGQGRISIGVLASVQEQQGRAELTQLPPGPITPRDSLNSRTSFGGTAPKRVRQASETMLQRLRQLSPQPIHLSKETT